MVFLETKVQINVRRKRGTISRHIYDGFWMGEDSPIPNIGGIRHDIVKAVGKI